MLSIEESVKKYLEAGKLVTYQQQVKQKIYASGASAASLRVETQKFAGQLFGAKYFAFQFEGRAPGTMPPISKIVQWLKVKRLKLNPWAVATNIKKKGTRAYTDYTKRLSITEQLAVHKQELLDNVGKAYSTLIVLEMKNVSRKI